MNILNRYIDHQTIIKFLLGLSVIGVVSIFLFVNRMNSLLNTDLGFNKDSVLSIVTKESPVVLSDSFVFSSNIPGIKVKKMIELQTKNNPEPKKIALQYISDSYFDFFNYETIIENRDLLVDIENTQMVYVNELAVKELGFDNIEEALGTRIESGYKDFILCGVVKDEDPLSIWNKKQAVIFQINPEHLAYAFFDKKEGSEWISEENENLIHPLSIQTRIKNHFRIMEDIIYSAFLFINILIFIICLGWIGSKYANKNEKAFFSVLGIGIHVLTIIVSKTYFYIIAILGLIAGPLSVFVYKIWLGVYENKVSLKTIDLFIFMAISLVAVYLIVCPKNNIKELLKVKTI